MTALLEHHYPATCANTVLTIANLIAAWLTQGPMRFWYLAAVCIVIGETGSHPFVLHTDDGEAGEHRRLVRYSRQGGPLAMASDEPRASRTDASRLARSAEGILLVREALWQRLTNCFLP
jgi:hypothetical protein